MTHLRSLSKKPTHPPTLPPKRGRPRSKILFWDFLKLILDYKLFKDTPIEDFAEDAMRDGSFHSIYDDRRELVEYLRGRGACREAVVTGLQCFKAWQRFNGDTV